MVNPNAGGAGEGNSKGDKGKGKMVMQDNSDSDKGKGKMIKTSKDDDIPVLPQLDLQTYETLAESLHKQMLEVKAWKERSRSEESTVKEGKEEEEEEEESKEFPEWDDPLALQLEELLIHNLRYSFQTATKKIAANGYSMEQAEWAVLTSGFYIGNNDIISNIVVAAMALLAKKEKYDPSERYIFETLENLANYALVEMVNVLKQVKPHLSVADAMWLLLLFDLNLIQAASEGQSVDHFSQLKSSTSTGNPGMDPKGSSSSTKDMFLQKGMAEMKKYSRGETTVYDVPATTTIVPEFEGAKRGRKATGKALRNVPGSSRKVTIITQRSIIPEKKPENAVPEKKAETPKTDKDEVIAALTQRKKQLERELQGWSDWTSVRVGQAAQKLRRNKEERKMLRQEAAADDDNWTHNEKHICELDLALHNVESLMKTANATLLRLQAEHTMLLKELVDSKLVSVSQNQNLQEVKLREQELLKQCRKLEAEIKFLQEDVARLKGEAAKLQQQIDKARKRQHEFEVLRQHEEREKIKLLEKAECIRRERQEMKQKIKMEEEKLIAKAEEDRVKYEERMKELRAQISAIKLGESSGQAAAAAAAAKKRERECVMCLTVDKTVVFLPCAHLGLCEECNELHQRMGMKDCPTCRTPIMQRIRVRFPPPKPPAPKP